MGAILFLPGMKQNMLGSYHEKTKLGKSLSNDEVVCSKNSFKKSQQLRKTHKTKVLCQIPGEGKKYFSMVVAKIETT